MIIDNKAIKERMREVAIKETKREVTEVRKMLWTNEFLRKIILHYTGVSKQNLFEMIRCTEFNELDVVFETLGLYNMNKLFRAKFDARVEEIMEEKAKEAIEVIVEEFEDGSKTD